MIAAVSGAIAAPGSAITGSTGRYFFKVPDLNFETKRAITKAKAWETLVAICDALHNAGRRGRTVAIRQDAESGKLGVGLKAIGREWGMSPTTVRRQVARLEALGLCVVLRPQILHLADPKTGKIVTKHKGRTPPALVYLTITDAHMRPAQGSKRTPSRQQAARSDGAQNAPHHQPPLGFKMSPLPKREKPKTAEPSGSLSRPAVSADGAGRHSAAGAGQEEVIVTTITPDEPGAVVTVDSTLSRPATPTVERRPQEPPGGEPAKTANVTTQHHNASPDANASTADGSGMDASQGSWADEYARLTGKKAAGKKEQEQAIDGLRAALDALPPSKRRRAKRLGKKAKAAAQAERDLIRLMKEKQGTGSKESAAAKKETYRQQYRAELAREVAVA